MILINVPIILILFTRTHLSRVYIEMPYDMCSKTIRICIMPKILALLIFSSAYAYPPYILKNNNMPA